MYKNAFILILLVIIIGGYSYYENKEYVSVDTIAETDLMEENKASVNTTASRESYERIKYQLKHHFVACFSTEKLSCTSDICEELEPITFWLLAGTRSNGTISRCDHQGCDTYDAIAQQSGIFENVQPKEPLGFIFKRQVLDIFGNPANPQEFVDIASIGLTTVISRGYCTEDI